MSELKCVFLDIKIISKEVGWLYYGYMIADVATYHLQVNVLSYC